MGRRNRAGVADSEESTWELWWDRNGETYLRLDLALQQRPVTGGDPGALALDAEPLGLPAARDALLAGLRNEDLCLAQECLLALARVAPAPARPALLAQIDHLLPKMDDPLRNVAVLCLGVLGDARSTTLLEEVVADSDRAREELGVAQVHCSTRSAAALALGLLGREGDVQILLRALGSADCDQLRSCLLLGAAHAAPADPLVAGTLLHHLRSTTASENLRSQAAIAVSRLATDTGRAFLPDLLELLADAKTPEPVKSGVLLALGRLGDLDSPDTMNALRTATSSPAAAVRESAWIALGRLLERDDDVVAHSKLRGSGLGFLLHAAQFPDRPLDRPWAALAAGLAVRAEPMDSPRRVVVCQELLASMPSVPSPSDLGAVLLGAGLTGCSGVSTAAIDLLEQDGDAGLRVRAAQTLRLCRDASVSGRLERVLSSPGLHEGIRKETVRALVACGGSRSLAQLLRDPLLPARSALERSSEAWGASRDPLFLEPLVQLLADDRSGTVDRARAARAIGTLAEPGTRECFRPYTEDSDWLLEDPMLEAYLLLE